MKRYVVLSSIALVLAGPASTYAQQAPASNTSTQADDDEAPPTVPTSEPAKGRRLSHINGVPVKVGEHTEYYYDSHKFRPVNIAVNPIGLIVGMYGVSVSVAVTEQIAIRGEFTAYNLVDSESSGTELDVGVPFYFKKMYSGFFVEPGIMYRSMDSGYGDADVEFGPQALVGWHWSWDSGFNVVVAGGAGRNFNSQEDEWGGSNTLFVNGYFKVGKQF